ncbi:hypothetical protein ACNHFS_004682 [Yersinia enterocolitica]
MKIKDIVKQISVYATSPFVAFSIGAVVVMLLDVYVTKGIDSSFVSACMDVVMAGAAVGAVLIARNYLAQFTAQEGYKIAIELVNDVLPEYQQLIKEQIFFNDILHIANESYENGRELYSIKEKLGSLEKILARVKIFTKKINQRLFKMKTYGLLVSTERSYSLHLFLSAVQILELDINSLEREFNEIINNKAKVDRYRKDALKVIIDSINTSFKQISNSYEKLIGEDQKITNLFRVK